MSSIAPFPFTLPIVPVRVASLSPYAEEVVRGLLPADRELEIILVPPPPAPDAVLAAVAGADLVLADKRHRHRLGRDILAAMIAVRSVHGWSQ